MTYNYTAMTFGQVSPGEYFEWSSHICRKVSPRRFDIIASQESDGKTVHRRFSGTRLAMYPKERINREFWFYQPRVKTRFSVV